ncbi:LOW QUALITY PROTEIN: Na(+) H(+) antiporter subunit D [Bacillus sp. JCM 19047]|nr:LOW QUALITY PROTEIN: Na(+) H(+) antiporter subunit D [Bacillus sp. JCM 19047]
MSNLLVIPMVLPLIVGIILIFLRPFVRTQRIISFLTMLLTFGVSTYLLVEVQRNGIQTLDFGGWDAPYGITFVGDSFSLLLTATAYFIAAIVLIYVFATIGEEKEKMFVYPLILLLLAGVACSFLTGDLFNLYVGFEVMLLASYALIVLGGEKGQLRESIKYVLVNVFSSFVFLIAIAFLYGTLGTLNFAQLSLRVAEAGQPALLTTIAIVLLLVFSLKAGLLLYFWLPGSYGAPPMGIAALFGALLTKVGIYALFRVFTLLFYHEPDITHTLIGIMLILTMIGGSIGAIAYNDLRKIIAYNVVIAVGFILSGLAIANQAAIEGSIFYLVHDMIVKALLFLLIGATIYLSNVGRLDRVSGMIRNYPLLGWMFFITMISLAGIPPLSGFIGKVYVAQGAIESGAYVLLAFTLISSIFVLYSLLRIFRAVFFGESTISKEDMLPMKKAMIIPSIIFCAASFALGFGVEGIAGVVSDAAETLMNPTIYIDAVLNQGGA